MKQDFALTEITGFLLIITLVLLFAAVFTASALPEILEQRETDESEELLFCFASIQEEMDSLTLAEESRITGKADLEYTGFGKAYISLSYGKEIPFAGDTYREAVITYNTENPASGKLELSLGDAGVKKNGKQILPAAYRLAVHPNETAEQMEVTPPFRIEYTWQETIIAGGKTYQVFIVRFA